MGKWGIFFLRAFALLFMLASMAFFTVCKKETLKEPLKQETQTASAEVDIQKITAQTGIRFRIIKTDARGYMPLHKYFWVCVPDETPKEKVEALVREILKSTVAKFSNTYHSFTFHLFYETKLTGNPEDCQPFARATFLPEGDWIKVGRAPIDGYKTYQLALEFTGKDK